MSKQLFSTLNDNYFTPYHGESRGTKYRNNKRRTTMDKKTQQQPGDASLQLRTAPSDLLPQASPTQSYSSDDQSPRSGVPARRRSLPHTRSNRSPPGNINTKQPLARSTKSMSAGVRERTSHGSLMNMTGTLSAASEVTYTPTTHRISKAKKGKKVHACEYPGCSKVCFL